MPSFASLFVYNYLPLIVDHYFSDFICIADKLYYVNTFLQWMR